jgi:hypothetical protein
LRVARRRRAERFYACGALEPFRAARSTQTLEVSLLELASNRWSELTDAYGSAAPVPSLLSQLSKFTPETGSSEPWHSLWSRLCHQGDVYSASFAAVPHILAVAGSAPSRVTFSFFQLPAAIELARHEQAVEIPDDLEPEYRQALTRIPELAAKASSRPWDADFCQAVLAAVAASRAQYELAALLTDVESSDISGVLEWYRSR